MFIPETKPTIKDFEQPAPSADLLQLRVSTFPCILIANFPQTRRRCVDWRA